MAEERERIITEVEREDTTPRHRRLGDREPRRIFTDAQAESLAKAYLYLLQIASEREENERK